MNPGLIETQTIGHQIRQPSTTSSEKKHYAQNILLNCKGHKKVQVITGHLPGPVLQSLYALARRTS